MILIEDLGIIYPTPTAKRKARCGIFKCPDCGTTKTSRFTNIKPNSKCRKCSRLKHGLKNHRLYPTWIMQGQRCNNPKNKDYKHYGARGIKRSDEFSDFAVWLKYIESINKPNGKNYSIDRVNNNKGYERGNLKWSSQSDQMLNTRLKSTNTTGHKGVSPHGDKFQATYRGKYIGLFSTEEEAAIGRDKFCIDNNINVVLNFRND